jgi:hypothetical protein
MKNIVLVHGAFVDGAHWEPVYRITAAAEYLKQVVLEL